MTAHTGHNTIQGDGAELFGRDRSVKRKRGEDDGDSESPSSAVSYHAVSGALSC
jgi:hypothetical protein